MPIPRYFVAASVVTVIGLCLGAWVGYVYDGTVEGALSALFICAFLSVLEISLSFDNAIVNARILETMHPRWQRRFLTWGIVIAVFGMRIVFPLAIVAFAASLNPFEALDLAIYHPAAYSGAIEGAHTSIAAFGGTFLMMVALRFFFDRNKEVHWIRALEVWLSRFSRVQSIEIALVLLLVLAFSMGLPDSEWIDFLSSAIWGLLVFLLVEGVGRLFDASHDSADIICKAGFGAFLYLEVLDASFSFDGVVGAFALSSNLFIIAIGLGIGAFYIRSMTIMLVEKQTLTEYRYLEHGAFYAILALAFIMFTQVHMHVPEMVTGVIGVVLILLSFYSSVTFNRKNRRKAEVA